MTEIIKQPRIKLTDEEKKEKKRLYSNEYMRNRRINDTEFAEKQRALSRANNKKRYDEDPEFRKKKGDAYKERYQLYKNAYKEVRMSVESNK